MRTSLRSTTAYTCHACLRRLRANHGVSSSAAVHQTQFRRHTTGLQHEATSTKPSLRALGDTSSTFERTSIDAVTPRKLGDLPEPRPKEANNVVRRHATQTIITNALPASEASETRHMYMRGKVNSRFAKNRSRAAHERTTPRTPEVELLVRKKKTMRSLQWGAIQFRHSDSELPKAKKNFLFWRRAISLLRPLKKPLRQPWLEEGRWLLSATSTEDMQQAWDALDLETQREKWPSVMLSTLYLEPDSASQVLSVTLDCGPPGYAIPDVLLFIVKRLEATFLKSPDGQAKADELLELLTRVIKDLPPGHMPFNQRLFGLCASKLPPAHTQVLYDILRESRAMLHPNTALHFARKLAGGVTNSDYKQTAFSILKELSNQGLDLNKLQPASVITSLLHYQARDSSSSSPSPAGTFSAQQALQWFMEKGFLPNVITFTAFCDTLCQQGEEKEAVRIAHLFLNNGLQFDAQACAVIFRCAKHSLDTQIVRETLDLAKHTSVPRSSLLSNAVHTILSFAMMEMREKQAHTRHIVHVNPFLPMLRIYARQYELEPLQHLIPDSLPLMLAQDDDTISHSDQGSYSSDYETTIVPLVEEFASSMRETRYKPSSTILATMFRAYIKSLRRPYDIMSLYSNFKTQLKDQTRTQNPTANLVRNERSLIHDTFILAMMQYPWLTRPALEVFGDMLKDNMGPSLQPEVGGSSAARHPMPTFFTFSIILSGLRRRGEDRLAEQVMQVMKEHGVQPNIVTWNVIIRGYALMQNLPKTVRALQGLEASGFRPNEFTFRAFEKLHNQRDALKMVESIIEKNRQRINEHQHKRTFPKMYDI